MHYHTPQRPLGVLMTLALDAESVVPEAFLEHEFLTEGFVFSPQGDYVAYVSNVSGRNEVYVRPFPGPGGQTTVSVGGGTEPVWAETGELFYRSLDDDRVMVVEVDTSDGLEVAPASEVFDTGPFCRLYPTAQYDVPADGQRFLMLASVGATDSEVEIPAARLVLVQNWTEKLRRVVPAE